MLFGWFKSILDYPFITYHWHCEKLSNAKTTFKWNKYSQTLAAASEQFPCGLDSHRGKKHTTGEPLFTTSKLGHTAACLRKPESATFTSGEFSFGLKPANSSQPETFSTTNTNTGGLFSSVLQKKP